MRNSKGRFTCDPRPEKRTGKKIKCKTCNKFFYIPKCKIGKSKFCSNKCRHMGHKGKGFGFQHGKKHFNWKGGNTVDAKGYIRVKVWNHPFAHKYMRRGRFVAEQILGRYLDPKETVHHIDENKQNDKKENLFIFENFGEHSVFHNCLKTNPFLKTWLKSNLI